MKTQNQKLEIQKQYEFKYMLLSRLKMDVNYWLGNGERCDEHLYFREIKRHISKMIEIWKILPYKPDWLKAVDLINLKKRCR
jgi:hypothetical protein